MIDGRPGPEAVSGNVRSHMQNSIWPRLTVSRLVVAIAIALIFAAAGLLLLVALVRLIGGYTPSGIIKFAPGFLGITAIGLVLVGLVALCGIVVAPFLSRLVADRRSIRARLTVSHLVAVTASTFVYAIGGFLLLIAVLYLSGYTPVGMVQLIPQFLGVTSSCWFRSRSSPCVASLWHASSARSCPDACCCRLLSLRKVQMQSPPGN